MPFSDLEDPKPEESYANASDANYGARKEKEDQQQEDNVVDREDLRRLDEDPIHRVEDVCVSKHISAMAFAD